MKLKNDNNISEELKVAGIKIIKDLRYNSGKNYDDVNVDVFVELSVKFE